MSESIDSQRGLDWLLFSVNGRLNRKKYIFSFISLVLSFSFVLTIWQYMYFETNHISNINDLNILDHLFFHFPVFLFLYFFTTIEVKRFNDIGIGGRYVYIHLIFTIIININYYLKDIIIPVNILGPLIIFTLVFGLILTIVSFFEKGTEGVNKYGEDPLRNIWGSKWKAYL